MAQTGKRLGGKRKRKMSITVTMTFESLDDLRNQLGAKSAEVTVADPVTPPKKKRASRRKKDEVTPEVSTVDGDVDRGELPDDHLLTDLKTELMKASDRTSVDEVRKMLNDNFDGGAVAVDVPPAKRQEALDLAQKLGA